MLTVAEPSGDWHGEFEIQIAPFFFKFQIPRALLAGQWRNLLNKSFLHKFFLVILRLFCSETYIWMSKQRKCSFYDFYGSAVETANSCYRRSARAEAIKLFRQIWFRKMARDLFSRYWLWSYKNLTGFSQFVIFTNLPDFISQVKPVDFGIRNFFFQA